MNDNARKMAEDILNMLVGWEVVDKNDPDYELFTQGIAVYLEATLNKIEPVYQQKPVEEWQEGRREE